MICSILEYNLNRGTTCIKTCKNVMSTSNGTALKAPEKNGKHLTAVKTSIKIEPAQFTKDGEKVPALDDRLLRLQQLFKLQQDYNKLHESLTKLNQFEIKNDRESSVLKLGDDSRNEFYTGNSSIISEVVDFLKLRIKEKIAAIEPKLVW